VEGVSWMKLDFQPKLQKRTRKIFEEKQKQVNTRNSENVTLLNLKKNGQKNNFNRTQLKQLTALA